MLDQIGICGVWRMGQAWVFLVSLLEPFLLFHKLHSLAETTASGECHYRGGVCYVCNSF